jgi:putative transposase
MRQAGIAGIRRRKGHGCTRRDPDASPSEDLVKRQFTVDEPDRLWVMDVTEHPTDEGKVYLGVVVDAFSRRVVGWSIADHIRSELVVDAVQMAVWRRQPPEGQCVAHSDHGAQAGLNRSSQRLDRGGVVWERCGSASEKCSCIGARFRRRAGRRSHGGRTGCGSGRRSPTG